jgi:flagellar hook-associated protein 1 FlgK
MQQGVADMAQQIATRSTTQLAAGYAMDGSNGKPLFTYNPGSTSNMLQVAAASEPTGPRVLGRRHSRATPATCNSWSASRARRSRHGLGTVLLSDADTQLVGKLGRRQPAEQGRPHDRPDDARPAVADWQSTSGVNQDEEAVNLVEYQNMYQANMKVMSVANALFDATWR